jgi:CheY-like chemotaxis protein
VKKIAVVEDNPDNRLLVRTILEPLYEVCEYTDGRSMLEGLAGEQADLLLLDISLPEMDGVAVLGRMRATPELCGLPVIALTAHAMIGDRERYLGLGFDDYVTKPIVDEKVLLDAIQRQLAGGQPARDAASKPTGVMASGTLEQLRKLGGDSFAAEMIGVFLEYVAKKIAQPVLRMPCTPSNPAPAMSVPGRSRSWPPASKTWPGNGRANRWAFCWRK